MSNPLFQAMGGGAMPGPMNAMQTMMQSFAQFRNAFTGDARQVVQGLLNSGRMSQQQFNQLQQMAQQFQSMMPR